LSKRFTAKDAKDDEKFPNDTEKTTAFRSPLIIQVYLDSRLCKP
jgi:hypothetical protein